ncbi:hypothetical protein, partial [Anaerocolumna jejuensis]|uniref:hypothetical protein n=1 Tax=Anaerocolumna jejuensis TaxID=259063 RepID=UPI003F7B511F
ILVLFIIEFDKITISINVCISAILLIALLFIGWFLTLNNQMVKFLNNCNSYCKGIYIIIEQNNNSNTVQNNADYKVFPLSKNKLYTRKKGIKK